MQLDQTPFDYKKGEFLLLEIPTMWFVTLDQSPRNQELLPRLCATHTHRPRGTSGSRERRGL